MHSNVGNVVVGHCCLKGSNEFLGCLEMFVDHRRTVNNAKIITLTMTLF